MNIEQLRYFIEAATLRSYAKAAESCFTTRQNVSRSVRSLEQELGVTLLERHGNAIDLTPAGSIALSQARSIIDMADNMKYLFAQDENASEGFDILMSTNLFSGIPHKATSLIDDFTQGNKLSELTCEQCYERIRNREADVAIVTAMDRAFPDVNVADLGRSASYLLVGEQSRLASRSFYSISDLFDVDLVLMSTPPFQYAPLFNLLGALNYNTDRVDVVSSTSTMLHLIKKRDFAAVVTDMMAGKPPEGTRAIPITDERVDWHLYALFTTNPAIYPLLNRLIKDVRTLFS